MSTCVCIRASMHVYVNMSTCKIRVYVQMYTCKISRRQTYTQLNSILYTYKKARLRAKFVFLYPCKSVYLFLFSTSLRECVYVQFCVHTQFGRLYTNLWDVCIHVRRCRSTWKWVFVYTHVFCVYTSSNST